MLSFIQNLSNTQLILGAAIIGYLLYSNWDWLKSKFTKVSDAVTDDSTQETDPDYLDLQALKRLRLRGESLDCPEYNQGISLISHHFFSCPPEPPKT